MPYTGRLSRIVVGVCLPLLILVAAHAPARTHAAGTTLLGVYYGNQGWKMDQVAAMERWHGKSHAVVLMFTDFCDRSMKNVFGQQLSNIWNNRNVPMISWEPYLCAGTPDDIELRIAQGAYDAYLDQWATSLKQWLSGPDGAYGTADDRRAYLRLAHEMNGNWYPWSGDPAGYISMWQRVYQRFAARGIDRTRLQWVWAVNHDDVGAFTAEQYYPGAATVDWLAMDGYNWGASQSWSSWKMPAEVFGPMRSRLSALSASNPKPMAITETSSTTTTVSGVSVTAKNEWLAALCGYVAGDDIRMLIPFNEDKETDWAIFGGVNGDSVYRDGRTNYAAYSAYRQCVVGSAIVGSSASTPRLLTDAQFAGQ